MFDHASSLSAAASAHTNIPPGISWKNLTAKSAVSLAGEFKADEDRFLCS
jgi:hypothetical protein